MADTGMDTLPIFPSITCGVVITTLYFLFNDNPGYGISACNFTFFAPSQQQYVPIQDTFPLL
jgi:hypothetical protein